MKAKNYCQAKQKILAMLSGEDDIIVKMATVVAVLHQSFDYYYWTGFYRHLDDELIVGPYQGTPACMHIAIGRGVCGTAAKTRRTQLVKDVDAFPGHIACDASSKSEVVVPVLDSDGQLIAVLDVDSSDYNSFDQTDARELESIIAAVFS